MNTFKNKYKYLIMAIGLAVIVLGLRTYEVSAIAVKDLGATMKFKRYRMSYTELASGTLQDNLVNRRVNILTLGPGDQIMSIVSNVTTPFTMPSGSQVYSEGIRAALSTADEGSSAGDVSRGDLAFPPLLSVGALFENRLGNGFEYAFYDEALSTDIYMIARAGEEDLAGLTAGSVDFYVAYFDN